MDFYKNIKFLEMQFSNLLQIYYRKSENKNNYKSGNKIMVGHSPFSAFCQESVRIRTLGFKYIGIEFVLLLFLMSLCLISLFVDGK